MKEKSIEKLKAIGISNEKIIKILNSRATFTPKDETLAKSIEDSYSFFLEQNLEKNEIIKMFCKNPEIMCLSKENLKDKLLNLENNGYTKKETRKLCKINPKVLNYTIEYVNKKIKDLQELGFTKKEVLKMTLKAATLLDLDIEKNIKKKIADMMALGFTYNEILRMSVLHPELFSYNIARITKRISEIESLGFEKEIAKYLIYKFPALLGLSFDNIKEKINYIKDINAIDGILINPANLMQSVSVTYARNEYFKNNNIDFDIQQKKINYLFCGNALFEKKFGVSKNVLLNRYNYKEYCEEKNNGKDL